MVIIYKTNVVTLGNAHINTTKTHEKGVRTKTNVKIKEDYGEGVVTKTNNDGKILAQKITQRGVEGVGVEKPKKNEQFFFFFFGGAGVLLTQKNFRFL